MVSWTWFVNCECSKNRLTLCTWFFWKSEILVDSKENLNEADQVKFGASVFVHFCLQLHMCASTFTGVKICNCHTICCLCHYNHEKMTGHCRRPKRVHKSITKVGKRSTVCDNRRKSKHRRFNLEVIVSFFLSFDGGPGGKALCLRMERDNVACWKTKRKIKNDLQWDGSMHVRTLWRWVECALLRWRWIRIHLNDLSFPFNFSSQPHMRELYCFTCNWLMNWRVSSSRGIWHAYRASLFLHWPGASTCQKCPLSWTVL